MTRRVMDNLYKELENNGFTFIEQEWRFLSKGCGGKEDYICFGVLRNSDGVPFTPMHLYKILNIARQKKAYMVQIIGEKDIKNPRLAAAANATPMKKNDIRVCFIQMGLIRAIEKARVPVMESLGRSFAYCQEDESVLALEKTLEQLQEELVRFELRARDVDFLVRNSIRFRWFLKKEEETFSRMNEIMDYMESDAYEERAETLCMAFLALSMTL